MYPLKDGRLSPGISLCSLLGLIWMKRLPLVNTQGESPYLWPKSIV
jgi:hypothetical protein